MVTGAGAGAGAVVVVAAAAQPAGEGGAGPEEHGRVVGVGDGPHEGGGDQPACEGGWEGVRGGRGGTQAPKEGNGARARAREGQGEGRERGNGGR